MVYYLHSNHLGSISLITIAAGLNVPVTWTGQDDLSGIRHYDVQVKEGASVNWTDWLSQTTQTQSQFIGTKGYSYTFRIKATDNVSNTTQTWQESQPVTINAVTKYYTHGDQRVAMRQGDVVYYLHGDHLGSTSLTTDQDQSIVSEVRYLPYGAERWTNGATPTDFTFTGQRAEAGFGLMDYNARYYSPRLGRFVSPDTVVPDPSSSSGFNRYRYARNNPLKYTDPSGHAACIDIECEDLVNPITGDIIGNEANQSVTTEFVDNVNQFIDDNINPEVLVPTGAAWRFDGSAMIGVGVDINIDITWLWGSGEFDVLGSGSAQGGPTGQGGASTGLVIHFNVDDMETLKGDSYFAGGAFLGGEVEAAYGQNSDGSPAISVYGGAGPDSPSIGYPVYGGVGKTYAASDIIDQANHLYNKTEEAIWNHTTQGYYGSYPRR